MKDLVITQSWFQAYPSIFHVGSNLQLTPLQSLDLSIPLYSKNSAIFTLSLPLELIDKIIDDLISQYISDGAIYAVQRTVLINRATLIRFFDKYFYRSCKYFAAPRYLTLIHQICQTFWILESTQTTLDSKLPEGAETVVLTCHVPHSNSAVYPWSTNTINIDFGGHFAINPPVDYQIIHTSAAIKDTYWIAGKSRHGVIKPIMVKTPVLVFNYVDQEGISVFEANITLQKSWKGFSALLKQMFGPHTGVFMGIQDNADHFVFSEHIIVEI